MFGWMPSYTTPASDDMTPLPGGGRMRGGSPTLFLILLLFYNGPIQK